MYIIIIIFINCNWVVTRWQCFSQPLNVHGVNYIRKTEIPTTKLLVPEPNAFDFELDIEKLKGHKSPGNDKIPAELIKAGCRKIRYEIHKLISSV